MTKKIVLVAGARPNFIKIAPIIRELKKHRLFRFTLVHSGQHYDKLMSAVFFRDLKIIEPDVNLRVGSASHAAQTAEIMKRFEKFLIKKPTDLVLVVGDVNSTLACSLVASKLNIKIAHVEAGLRSFDRTMPEEINRIVTDSLSDFLFTTTKDASLNVLREGVAREKIFLAGNVMIDSLLNIKNKITHIKMNNTNSPNVEYAVLTLHRPTNVDDKGTLLNILKAVNKISREINVIFSCHPRTAKFLKIFNFKKYHKNFKVIDPLGYLDFFKLMSGAAFVLTDSGGIQEETTILDIPCLTLRDNTERPVTVKYGTNIIVGTDPKRIVHEAYNILSGDRKRSKQIPYWDGRAAVRIVDILRKKLI